MEKGIFRSLWVIFVILLMVLYEFNTKNDDIYTYKKKNQFSIENIPKDDTHRTKSYKDFLETEEKFHNRKLSEQNQIENKYLLKDGFWMKDYKDSGLSGRNVPRNYFVYTIYDILREMNRLQGSIDDHLRGFEDTSERFAQLSSLLRDLTPPSDDGDLIVNEVTGASVTNTSGNNGNIEPRSTDQNLIESSAGINTTAATAGSVTNTSGHNDNDEPRSTEQTPVPVEASSGLCIPSSGEHEGINTAAGRTGFVTNTSGQSDNVEPRSSEQTPDLFTPSGDYEGINTTAATAGSVTNTSGHSDNDEPRSTEQTPVPVEASSGSCIPSSDEHEGINTTAERTGFVTYTFGQSDNVEPRSSEQTPVQATPGDHEGINTTAATAGSVTNTSGHNDNDEPRSTEQTPVPFQASSVCLGLFTPSGDHEGINTTAGRTGFVTNTSGQSDNVEPRSSEQTPVHATPVNPRLNNTSNTSVTGPSVRNTVTSVEGQRILDTNIVTSVSRLPNQNLERINNHNHVTTNIDIGRNAYKYPEYRVTSTRLATFYRWPLPNQAREQMAEAGFIYAGHGDCVRCFVCGIGLRNWEPEDDPWIEHARWNPNCRYVLQSKGKDFVDLVRQFARIPDSLQLETPVRQQRETLSIGLSRRRQGQIMRNPLQSQAAQEVISQGYAPRAVREALDIFVRDYEWHLLDAGLLVQILVSIGASRNTGRRQETNQKDGNDERGHILEENRRLKEQYTCKICLEGKVEIVFLPCGHLCCCAQCAPALSHCPICRQRIKGTVKTILNRSSS